MRRARLDVRRGHSISCQVHRRYTGRYVGASTTACKRAGPRRSTLAA